jgi:hypothetical protein
LALFEELPKCLRVAIVAWQTAAQADDGHWLLEVTFGAPWVWICGWCLGGIAYTILHLVVVPATTEGTERKAWFVRSFSAREKRANDCEKEDRTKLPIS